MKLVFWVGFWTFLLDQVTKYWIVHLLELRTITVAQAFDADQRQTAQSVRLILPRH